MDGTVKIPVPGRIQILQFFDKILREFPNEIIFNSLENVDLPSN